MCGAHFYIWRSTSSVPLNETTLQHLTVIYSILQYLYGCSSILQHFTAFYSILQYLYVLTAFDSILQYCKVFKDNSGALELARLPKLRPRTKHINVCYHHFREHVRNGLIKIFPVNTKDQIADALTKALAQNDFQRHHRFLCGQ